MRLTFGFGLTMICRALRRSSTERVPVAREELGRRFEPEDVEGRLFEEGLQDTALPTAAGGFLVATGLRTTGLMTTGFRGGMGLRTTGLMGTGFGGRTRTPDDQVAESPRYAGRVVVPEHQVSRTSAHRRQRLSVCRRYLLEGIYRAFHIAVLDCPYDTASFQDVRHVGGPRPKVQQRPADEAPVWHLGDDNGQYGPMPFAELAARVQRGEPGPNAEVWREGFDDWLPLREVKELQPHIKRAPPPRPPQLRELKETP